MPALYNVNFTWLHNQALKNAAAIEKATIKVEKINGRILLVSGEKDQWRPSADMSRKVMKRLEEHKFSHSYTHVECDSDNYPYSRKLEVWHAHFINSNLNAGATSSIRAASFSAIR